MRRLLIAVFILALHERENFHVIFPNRSLVVVPFLALACAAPMFQLGPAPPIPQAVALPPPPNPRPVPEGPAETQVDIAAAKSLPDFGQSSLGFLGFEPPSDAGIGDRRSFLDEALTMGAINVGFKHIADLGSAPEILVALNEEKLVNGVRSSTWWAGVMVQMAQVADVGRVDYILVGEFRNLQTTKQKRVTAFELPAEELTNYATTYARFRAESADRIQAATAARQAYQDEFNRAKTAYESEKAQKNWWERGWMDEGYFKQKSAECENFVAASGNAIVAKDGGKFPPPADQSGAPAAKRLAEYTAFSKSAGSVIAADKRALSETPDPGALDEQSRDHKKKVDVNSCGCRQSASRTRRSRVASMQSWTRSSTSC
jgi:hypothetical protein